MDKSVYDKVALNMAINTHTKNSAIIVQFDCYKNISFKQGTRTSSAGRKASCVFHTLRSSLVKKVSSIYGNI